MQLRMRFLLALSMAAFAQANTGSCVGKVLDTAAYMTAAGMQIAVVADNCGGTNTANDCEGQVNGFVSTFSKSLIILQNAVDLCGGETSACGKSVTAAFNEITALVSAVDALRAKGGVTGKNMQVLADEFTIAGTAITNSAKDCAAEPASVNEGAGFCVSKAMESATQVAAAGIAWDKTRKECGTGDAVTDGCRMDQAFVMNAISKAAERAVSAAKDCGGEGLLTCGMDLSTTSAKLAEASEFAIQTNDNWKGGVITNGGLANLDSLGETLGAASESIGSATTSCKKDAPQPEVNVGHCVADSITAAAYVATASMGIAVAAKDCADCETNNVAGIAQCITDVTYTIQNYAKTANEIIWATADCAKDEAVNTVCATDIGKAIESLAAAAAASANIAKFVIAENWVSGQGEFQSLGDALDAVGSSIGGAVATCVPNPPAEPEAVAPVPKVIGAVPVTGGHPATANAETDGLSGFDNHEEHGEVHPDRLWGLEANKWFHMKAKKQNTNGIFKYMAPAAAGAMGLVLLSIVTVSARLLSRRANARTNVQAASAREDAELLEELGE